MEKFAAKLIIVFAIVFRGFVHGDLEGDKRALLALQTAVGGRMVWNASGSACNWEGIRCSESRVVSVTLPARELSGIIPSGTVGNLTGLRKLRLRFNALQGSIPADLSNCGELRTLYLQENQFSGPFTVNLSAWPSLTRLNLAGNNFSGSVPASLGELKRLGTLFLENNSFTGPLPALELPELKQFNVSGNNLTGAIPDTLKSFPASSFAGTGLCNSPLQPCINNNNNNNTVNNTTNVNNGDKGRGKSQRVVIIIAIVVGCVVLVGVVFGIFAVVCRRKRTGDEISGKQSGDGEKQRGEAVDDSFTKEEYSLTVQEPEKINSNLVFFPSQKQQFSLEDLLRASAEFLGKGTVGTAYKAVLETGMFVVVKRMKDILIGPRDFAHQIHTVGKMRHKNLVAPIAYYYSSEEKLLIYDYMPMGSLSAWLHGNRRAGRDPLGWETRVHIALGAAMGIEYLHKQGKKISHGNIKSSNILLTDNYDACVSDFGLAQIVNAPIAGKRSVGYKAPEVTDIRRVSQMADVYSFGVLLLEILTGKSPNQASLSEQGVDLPKWVQSVVREEWTAEVFDVELTSYHHQQSIDEEEMVQLLQVGMACVAHYPDQRPTMSQVVKMIQDICQKSASPPPPAPELARDETSG